MQYELKSNECQRIWLHKIFKIEIQNGGQKFQTFGKIGSTKKLGPPSLIYRILKTLRKVVLNHAECIEI